MLTSYLFLPAHGPSQVSHLCPSPLGSLSYRHTAASGAKAGVVPGQGAGHGVPSLANSWLADSMERMPHQGSQRRR